MKLNISYEEQSDGAVWKRYKTPSGISVLVTQAFRQLLQEGENIITGDFERPTSRADAGLNQNESVRSAVLEQIRKIVNTQEIPDMTFLRLLKYYRDSYEAGKEDDGIREFINKGGEATFFGIGASNIGIREEEKVKENGEDKIYRMDIISHLLELGGLPRWIRTPIQYGMITIPRDIYEKGLTSSAHDKFTIMEKIDSGVSVFDIIHSPRSDKLGNAIKKEFGFETLQSEDYRMFQQEIATIFEDIKNRLYATCLHFKKQLPEGTNFENLFTDLLDRNMLVSLNKPPIGGSRLSFWVIDQ